MIMSFSSVKHDYTIQNLVIVLLKSDHLKHIPRIFPVFLAVLTKSLDLIFRVANGTSSITYLQSTIMAFEVLLGVRLMQI